jgi:hypothetical protein
MAWVYLIFAGLFEIGYTSVMKLTEDFTRLWPTLLFVFCIFMSFVMLTRAAKSRSTRPTRYGAESAQRGLSSSASSSIRNR